MRNLKLTDVTTGVGMPLKSGSLQHIQLAYKEVIDMLTRGFVGKYDNTKGYVLYGCENSGTGSSYVISAGAIFYNGEIYLVDAVSFTISGSNVAVCTSNTTYFTATNADSVTFTDSNPRNVHEIRKIVIGSGGSGSGLFNYADLIFYNWKIIDVSDTFALIGPGAAISNTSILWKYVRRGNLVHANLYFQADYSYVNSFKYFKFDLPIQGVFDEFTSLNIGSVATFFGGGVPTSMYNVNLYTDIAGIKLNCAVPPMSSGGGLFQFGCNITYEIE